MGQSLQILPSRVPALPATVHWGAVADYTAYVAVTLHTDLHHWVACWSLFWWCTCTQTHSPPLFMSPNSLSHVHGCAVIWLCFKANGVLQKKNSITLHLCRSATRINTLSFDVLPWAPLQFNVTDSQLWAWSKVSEQSLPTTCYLVLYLNQEQLVYCKINRYKITKLTFKRYCRIQKGEKILIL